MSYFPGVRGQQGNHYSYRADGSIQANNTSQLLLPVAISRSFLSIQNTSNAVLWLEFGSARASCTISGGKVNAITIQNGGFGFTAPPVIEFLGGAPPSGNTGWLPGGAGEVGYAVPTGNYGHPAKAHCVIAGGVVTSIVIDDGGAGYYIAPKLFIRNASIDPLGCADPYYSSTNSGSFISGNGGNYYMNGTFTKTDQISIWGATAGQTFFCEYAP